MRLLKASLSALALSLSAGPAFVGPAHATTAQQETEVLLEGTFERPDGKRGGGTARIVREDGKLYLDFENFRTSRGPQLEIWITDRTVRSNADVQAAGYTDLGDLASHRKGSQRY